MEQYAPTLKDLAPRDIVSRAILKEISQGKGIDGKDYVHLDLREIGKERLNQKLPEITSFVKTYLGIDPAEAPIPVAPTCHYMMGGIPTDTQGHVLVDTVGSVLPGLYAVGECACVSVHGANRLGCNSLIDLVVFGKKTGEAVLADIKGTGLVALPQQAQGIVANEVSRLLDSKGTEKTSVLREAMQELMTQKVSVFREAGSLESALSEIGQLQKKCLHVGLSNKSTVFNYELQEALELRNMLRVAKVIVYSALARQESRGAHFRNDYPQRNDKQWLTHSFVMETASGLEASYKPVSITRFAPEKRRY